jgi:uncharacterized protein
VNIIIQVQTAVKEVLAGDRTGHGFDHIQRVFTLATQFASKENVDQTLVSLIALLHDVDDYKLVGIEAAKLNKRSLSIMKAAGVELGLQKQVIENISRMGYSRYLEGIRPTSKEGQLVSDADMCDAIGAHGLLRVYAYGQSKGQPFFLREAFPQNDIKADAYRQQGSNHTINHFFDKLLKLKDLMMTEPGKKEALLRHTYLVDFLKQFFKEERADAWITFLNTFLKEKH